MTMPLFQTDANNSIYFQNQLHVILANAYNLRPSFKYSNLLPIATEGGNMPYIKYRTFNQAGFAKIITSNSKDIPRVDIYAEEYMAKILPLAVSYGYSMDELDESKQTGVGLDSAKAAAAKFAIDIEINRIALLGDEQHGLQGLLTAPNVPVVAARNGASGSSDWNTKTPDEILADLIELAGSIADVSYGMEEPNTLILPQDKLALIKTMPRSTKSDTSIYNYFLGIQPNITQVEWLKELKGIGPGGSDMMMMYDKNPNKLVLRLPMPFEQLPVERNMLEYEIICRARCGGINMFSPLSCVRGVGI